MSSAPVLAGDVGGTTTRLALCRQRGGRWRVEASRDLPSRDHAGLAALARSFMDSLPASPQAACFGVPGPVVAGRCRTTNLPWEVDEAGLTAALGVPVRLMNDLEAAASGVACLGGEDLAPILPGQGEPQGTRAVLAAGTGLGEAALVWDGHRHFPLASEGGHATFAPVGEEQARLQRHLERRFGHVSWERVVSGPGLVNIYKFLRHERVASFVGSGEMHGKDGPDPLQDPDPPAAISRAALAGRSPLCDRALDLWVELLGAEAGNLALKLKATGGVYLAGGIAPRVRERLDGPAFRRAFTGKGRMRPLLESIPVHLIREERVALLGAACRAAEAAL